jgi:hypothetical protein
MNKNILIAALALSISLSFCGNSNDFKVADQEMTMLSDSPPIDGDNEKTTTQTESKKVIRNGSLSIEVKSIKSAKVELEQILKIYNAQITQEELVKFNHETQENIQISVPAQYFDSLVKGIEAIAENIESKNIHSYDVTEEYIDVAARLETKKQLEQRYKELLKQAKNIKEILEVESAITKERAEIESMEGRIKYIDNNVKSSTLSLILNEHQNSTFSFFEEIGNAINNGWTVILKLITLLFNLWALFVIGLIIYFIIRRNKALKRGKADNKG